MLLVDVNANIVACAPNKAVYKTDLRATSQFVLVFLIQKSVIKTEPQTSTSQFPRTQCDLLKEPSVKLTVKNPKIINLQSYKTMKT